MALYSGMARGKEASLSGLVEGEVGRLHAAG